MSDYNLGTARGVIEIQYQGDGADQARQGLQGIQGQSSSTEGALNDVANTAGKAGLVIAGSLAVAVKSATSFEQQMSAVKAVSGATGDQFQALSDKALQIGKDTTYSASEAGLAMEELAKAGISVEDILNGAAEATTSLAAAGGVDLTTAATVASNAMNQFGLGAEDMAHVADLFAGAANASATGVAEIGNAMAYVGPVARTAGLSIDDTAAAISVLANNGIDASSAGTALRGILAQLTPTTDKARTAFEKLGIISKDGSNAFYDAQGNLKDFDQVAAVLRKGVNSLGSEEEKTAVITAAFGRDSLAGVSAIANTTGEDLKDLQDVIGNTDAAEVAKTRLDNFAGVLEALQGSLETAAIAMGQVLIPVLSKVATGLGAAADAFNSLPGPVKTVLTAILAISAVALLSFAAITKIVFAVKNFVAALKVLRAGLVAMKAAAIPAWLATLGPILLVIAAVAAVVAIVILLWKKSETFRKIVTGAWEAIKTAAKSVWDFLKKIPGFFADMWDSIVGGVKAAAGFIKDNWKVIVAILTGPIGIVVGLIIKYWDQIKGAFKAGMNAIKSVVVAVWNAIVSVFTAVFNVIKTVVTTYFNIYKTIITTVLNVIKTVVMTVWNAIKTAIMTVLNVIRTVITTVFNVYKTIITTTLNVIKNVVTTVWNAIKAVITGVLNAIKAVITSIMNGIKATISSIWNAVKSGTTAAWNGIKSAVSGAINALMGIVNGVKGKIVGVFSGAGSWLLDAGKKIIGGLISGIESMFGKLGDIAGKVGSTIGKFIPGSPVEEGPLRVLNRGGAGKKIVRMIVDGLDDSLPEVRSGGRAMATSLEEALRTFSAPDYGSLVVAANSDSSGALRGLSTPPRGGGTAVATAPAPSKEQNFEINITNPVPERASDSLFKTAQRVAYLGLGEDD